MAAIYALIDPSGSIRYVGHSSNPQGRRMGHWYDRYRASQPQVAAWLRTLAAPPQLAILEVVEWADRLKAEERWTDQLRGAPDAELLNDDSGARPSARHRQRLSQATKGRPAEHLRGRSLTPEHRAKMSESHSGRTLSEAHRRAIGEGQRGKARGPLSEEHKAKLSDAGRRRAPLSAQSREKIAAAKRGKPRSEETKQKIRDAFKARRVSEASGGSGAVAQ